MKHHWMMSLIAASVLFAGSAYAQDRCETEVVGKSYTCQFTSSAIPDDFSVISLSFTDATAPEVFSAFQAAFDGLPFACNCQSKGKPGKLKSSAKSTEITCVEAHPVSDNNESFTAKVAGGGTKIVKGRYNLNASGGRTGVLTCIQD